MSIYWINFKPILQQVAVLLLLAFGSTGDKYENMKRDCTLKPDGELHIVIEKYPSLSLIMNLVKSFLQQHLMHGSYNQGCQDVQNEDGLKVRRCLRSIVSERNMLRLRGVE
jgi:hypothetical protein